MRIARRTVAVGAAAALAAGSALFGMAGVAAADTVSTQCGGSVQAEVGDTVLADTSVLGINLGTVDLGQVTEGTTVLKQTLDTLTGLVCRVTVTVTTTVDDVVDGTEDAVEGATGVELDPATDPIKSATESARQAAGATPESDPAESGPAPGGGTKGSAPGSGSGSGANAERSEKKSDLNPPSNSSVWGGSIPGFTSFPYSSFAMSAFGSYPTASIGSADFSTAPGLRYGVDFDDFDNGYTTGYAPRFGLLGDSPRSGPTGDPTVRNAGSADSLTPVTGNGIGLPMLVAVLALATASAGLVRAWVLRTATA